MRSDIICKGLLGVLQASKYSNVPLSYDAIASRRHRKGRPSSLPSSAETEALLSLEKRDLFTEDAWQGMLKYAHVPWPFLGIVGHLCTSLALAMLSDDPDALPLDNTTCLCPGQVCRCGTFPLGGGEDSILLTLSEAIAVL